MACSSLSKGEDSPAEELRNWLELPREVTASIFSRLFVMDIRKNTQFVCKSWFQICKDPLVWRKINKFNLGKSGSNMKCDRICRHAVDRSCGNLVDINIEYIGNDALLEYITDRCHQIKRLGLARCYCVCDDGLIKAITKLPLLEELDLSLCFLSIKSLEAVGRYCPRLRSLNLNRQSYGPWRSNPDELKINEQAIAIAKHMPELRHLHIVGNYMTNMGLQAILDGCPYLESLDLRRCLGIDLKGKLGKRCTEQIKFLCLPDESIDDFEFGKVCDSYDFYYGVGAYDDYFDLS